jgi:hypothetical protein
VRAWSAETGQPLDLPPFRDGMTLCVAFSPDGRLALTGGYDATARLWDAATWQPVGAPLPHQDPVWTVAFGADGETLLTAAGNSTGPLFQVQVWDAATRRPLGLPIVTNDFVHRLATSADGRLLLAARTGTDKRPGRVWLRALPEPADDDFRRVALWVQSLTGLELDPADTVRRLDEAERQARHDELARLGGPPAEPLDTPDAVRAWHEEQAHDCEAEGLWAAALWHLDRLLAADAGHDGVARWRDRVRAESQRDPRP